MMELQDSVVVVTGASRGVGRSIALALASEGARMALVALSEAGLEDVRREVEERGGEAVAIPTDLRVPDQIEAMVKETLATFGTVDAVINNAGWSPPLRPIQDTAMEDWDHVMQVNARAPYQITKLFLPTLLEKGSGHVINISSLVGKRGVATASAYCMSKAAVMAMGESLIAEASPQGIRMTNFACGAINTDMRWEATPDYPMEQVIEPEDVAQAVVNVLKMNDTVLIEEVPIRRVY
jgi:3-oxoacyl-[acyl-carrier protein] reductase